MNDITIIIPVRSGSVRCPQKNSRRFSDTNLLALKLSVLKNIKNAPKIIVSSSDTDLLDIARKYKVDIHVRDISYSQSNTTGSELFKCLADAVSTPHMLYTTCVAPFVTTETYQKAIDTYLQNLQTNNFDSVVCCTKVKEFLWLNQQPLNYDPNNAPPSQLLPDIFSLTFGFHIIKTQYVKDFHSIVGKRPYMFDVSEIEGIDIDTPFDFTVAELLYSNSFITESDVTSHNEMTLNNNRFGLLDCTVRDGGYLNNWNYNYEMVLQMYNSVSASGIEYFEVGFICNTENKDFGEWWNVSEKTINDLKIDSRSGCKLSAMIHLEHIHTLTTRYEHLDMIRVLINPTKTNLDSIVVYTESLSKLISLGYEIAVNIAYADTLTENQLDDVLTLINSVPSIDYVYIADTFGSITPKRLKSIIRHIKTSAPNVHIGFHGHNNTQCSIPNSIEAINSGVSIVDVTILGQGRGGGNTPCEIFLQHVNSLFKKSYNIIAILDFLESYSPPLTKNQRLVILHTMTGLHKLHPDTANSALESCSTLSKAYLKLCQSHCNN